MEKYFNMLLAIVKLMTAYIVHNMSFQAIELLLFFIVSYST